MNVVSSGRLEVAHTQALSDWFLKAPIHADKSFAAKPNYKLTFKLNQSIIKQYKNAFVIKTGFIQVLGDWFFEGSNPWGQTVFCKTKLKQ